MAMQLIKEAFQSGDVLLTCAPQRKPKGVGADVVAVYAVELTLLEGTAGPGGERLGRGPSAPVAMIALGPNDSLAERVKDVFKALKRVPGPDGVALSSKMNLNLLGAVQIEQVAGKSNARLNGRGA